MAPRAVIPTLALLAALPAFADESAPAEVPAAWTMHQIDLTYMGFTTRYTCGGLKSKMKLLLKQLGVRDDIKIVERNCEYGYGKVAEFPRLKITFYAPSIPEPGARDIGEPVLGVWKPVVIKKNSPRGLEMGDCELVEVFRDRVMPKFVTREVQGDVNCIPHQLVGNRIDLRFEVLTGIKSVDEAQALQPPQGEAGNGKGEQADD
jgi:hypothetical protein